MDNPTAFVADVLREHLAGLKAPDLAGGEEQALQTMAGMVARRIGHLDEDGIRAALERAFALALERARGWTWPTPATIIEGLPTGSSSAPETYRASGDLQARAERLAAGIRARQGVPEVDLFGAVAARAIGAGLLTPEALDEYRQAAVRHRRAVYRIDAEIGLLRQFGAEIEPYLGGRG